MFLRQTFRFFHKLTLTAMNRIFSIQKLKELFRVKVENGLLQRNFNNLEYWWNLEYSKTENGFCQVKLQNTTQDMRNLSR